MAESLWRNSDFVRLWSAQTVSTFGSLITRPALPFLAILALNASPLQIGVLQAADHIPGFLIGLFAGVVIDRLRRRPLLIAADIGRALLLGSIPMAAFVSRVGFGQLVIVAFLASALTVFFEVGYESYLPSIVPTSRLYEANGKVAASTSVAEVSAFGVAGWLVQIFSAPVAILVDAITFVASAIFIATIRTPEQAVHRTAEQPGVVSDISEGLRILLRDPVLRAIAGAYAAIAFSFGIVGTVISLYGLRELGFKPGLLGLIYAVGGASSLLAALFATRITKRLGVGPAMFAGLLLTGLGTLLLPLAHGAGLLAFALLVGQQVIGDGGATIFEINQSSLRQTLAPARALGRVNAATRSAGLGSTLLGIGVGVALAQGAGYRPALAIAGAASLLGALLLLSAPQLRTGRQATAATPR